MSLMSALNGALSGLRATQAQIDVVSRNVANASTPGYTRKVLPLQNHIVGNEGVGVRTLQLQRHIDARLQYETFQQSAVVKRYDVISDFMSRVDQMFGRPDEETSVAASVSRFTTAFQQLADSPEVPAVRQNVLSTASLLAQELNALSDNLQAMRKEAEDGIGRSVELVNDALRNIHRLNGVIAQRTVSNQESVDLEDQRDGYLRIVAEQIGVKFVQTENNKVAVFTSSGRALVDGAVTELVFSASSSITPQSSHENGLVGRIMLSSTGEDLLERGEIRTGVIAGYVAIRDQIMPQAQAQLDELAHALAIELASTPHPVAVGGASAVLRMGEIGRTGDVVTVEWYDPTLAPPNRQLILTAGTDFANTGDDQDIAREIGLALRAAGFVVPGDIGLGTVDLDADGNLAFAPPPGTALTSLRAFTEVGVGLALFADKTAGGEVAYRDIKAPAYANIPGSDQKVGFAQRIAVSAALLADTTLLVQHNERPPMGDIAAVTLVKAEIGSTARSLEMYRRLSQAPYSFSAATGLGGAGQPFRGSIEAFATTMVSFQASQSAGFSERHTHEKRFGDVLEQKLTGKTGVNVDDEMAQLILIQNAYGASARVMTSVQQMLDELLAMVR